MALGIARNLNLGAAVPDLGTAVPVSIRKWETRNFLPFLGLGLLVVLKGFLLSIVGTKKAQNF